jgi:prephenate dehydrogenase
MTNAEWQTTYFKMSRKIAILGPGLLGGSLAMEAGVAGFDRVALWARRPEALEEAAVLLPGVEVSARVSEVVSGAELVVLCVPVERMREVLLPALSELVSGAVVTDVGSVKGRVVSDLGAMVRGVGAVFVGGHPMAGSDRAGIAAARVGLFRGAVCVLTPEMEDGGGGVAAVEGMWSALGMRVVRMGAEEHDRAVALVSHLPHVVASGLVATIAGVDLRAFEVCGPGLRDTTRVASGLPSMWAEILANNAASVVPALEAFRERVETLIGLVGRAGSGQTGELAKFLEDAKVVRDGVRFP